MVVVEIVVLSFQGQLGIVDAMAEICSKTKLAGEESIGDVAHGTGIRPPWRGIYIMRWEFYLVVALYYVMVFLKKRWGVVAAHFLTGASYVFRAVRRAKNLRFIKIPPKVEKTALRNSLFAK